MELLESLQLVSTNSLLIFTSVILYIVYFFKTTFSYWSVRGVPEITVTQSLGSTFRLALRIDSFKKSFSDLYDLLEGHKYGGAYQFTTPTLIIRDANLIQNILVKGFSQFHDRSGPQNENLDILSGNLFSLTGDRWRKVRQKVSPAFSSAKLKIMFHNLKECAQELDNYLQRLTAETGYVDVEAKKLISDYTLDVIGACSMGIKCSSIGTGETDLKRISRNVFRFGFRRTLHAILEMISPKLPHLLRWKVVEPEVEEFFMTACREAAALREHESSARKDFLAILINIRKSEEALKQGAESLDDENDLLFSDHIIAGIISSFFGAGFEPAAATMTLCLFELAQHPEVLEKLYAEIQSVKEEFGEEITYESLKKFRKNKETNMVSKSSGPNEEIKQPIITSSLLQDGTTTTQTEISTSTISTSPTAGASLQAQHAHNFSFLGSFNMENNTTTVDHIENNAKKPRNDMHKFSPSSILSSVDMEAKARESSNKGFNNNPLMAAYAMGDFGRFDPHDQQMTANFHGNNGVSLTLGLPPSENLAMPVSQQNYLSNQNIELGSRPELGSHFTRMGYENIDFQSGNKRFPTQLLPDFVTGNLGT